MPTYAWKGIDTTGKTHKGITTIHSPDQLKSDLLQKHIALLSYRKKTIKKVSLATVANFFHHLKILIEHDIPLEKALLLTRSYTSAQNMRHIIDELICTITCGATLSDAMKHSKSFSQLMIHIVIYGEQADNLPHALHNLSSYLTKKQALVKKLQQAALLPAITLVFAMSIMLVLFIFVIPQFEPMIRESGQTLATSTKLVLTLSHTLASEGFRIFLILVLFGVLLAKIFLPIRSYIPPWLALLLPFVGQTIVLSNLTQLTQTLALLLQAGVPLDTALTLARKTCSNELIAQEIKKVTTHVISGKPLHQAFVLLDSPYIPHHLIASIDLGEQTGRLDLMLAKSANLFEAELHARADRLTTLTQPILLVITGLIIAFLMLSIYLPIFDATSYASPHFS